MAKLTKILLTISMVLAWGWTLFMGTFATHTHGRAASWLIGLSLIVVLSAVYSYLKRALKQSRNGLTCNRFELCNSHLGYVTYRHYMTKNKVVWLFIGHLIYRVLSE
ncbi:hypothetical protein [Spirosoma pollinicola]|uniref:hypothetical protein n=1 Tax=Spirosoma pollinicola TaxID=2057025 RepID=UPI0012FDBD31|nr:hypothetical protein [Spirosoma pollinicola]